MQPQKLRHVTRHKSAQDYRTDWFRVCDVGTPFTKLNMRKHVKAVYLTQWPSDPTVLKAWLETLYKFNRDFTFTELQGGIRVDNPTVNADGTKPFQTFHVYPLHSSWFVSDDIAPDAAERAIQAVSDALVDETWNEDADGARAILPALNARYTGLRLIEGTFPAGHYCDVLSESDRAVIRSIPQSRVEIYKPGARVNELWYYDAPRFYQNLLRSLAVPVGTPAWEMLPAFDHHPAFYHVQATVPRDWPHIGLIADRDDWPRKPGRTFDAWVSTKEFLLLMDPAYRTALIKQALPFTMTDWNVRLIERIVFYPPTGTHSQVHALKRFSAVLDGIEERLRGHADYPSIVSAIKMMVDGTLGLLAARKPRRERITKAERQRREIDPTRTTVRPDEQDARYVLLETSGEAHGVDAYQVTAALWGEARARLTRWLMCVPYDALIAADTDAIFTTCSIDFPCGPWRASSNIRLKGMLHGPLRVPSSMDGLRELAAQAKRELETHAA